MCLGFVNLLLATPSLAQSNAAGLTRHSEAADLEVTPLTQPDFSAEEILQLNAGQAILRVWKDKKINDGAADIFGGIDIKASPEIIWAIMIDCERNKTVIKSLKSCEVLQTSAQGETPLWDVRQQTLRPAPLLPLVKTQFKTEFYKPSHMRFARLGGDMKIQHGRRDLTPIGNGMTRLSYRARIKPKFPVPGALLRRGTRKDMPLVLRTLKQLSENDMSALETR